MSAMCCDSFQVFYSVVNRGSGLLTGPFNLCIYIYVSFLGEGGSAFIRFFEKYMTLKNENHFFNMVVLKLKRVTESSPGGLVKQDLLDPTSTISDSSRVRPEILHFQQDDDAAGLGTTLSTTQ